MNPKVSIIIPTYNSEQTIADCLKSIVNQTFTDIEVVIADGHSTDNTGSIVRDFAKHHSFIKFFSEKDEGIYDAMNKGIDRATGDYLFFIGSDDLFYSENVLRDIFFNNDITGFDFIYGNVYFRHARKIYSGESSLEKLVGEQVSICHQAIFYKKEIFTTIGKYDLKYFIHADYDLNVKCFENPDIRKHYINTIVTLYNERGISGTQSNKDFFHDHLTLKYITHYSSPFELVLKLKSKERELEIIKNSTAYKMATAFSRFILKLSNLKRLVVSLLKKGT